MFIKTTEHSMKISLIDINCMTCLRGEGDERHNLIIQNLIVVDIIVTAYIYVKPALFFTLIPHPNLIHRFTVYRLPEHMHFQFYSLHNSYSPPVCCCYRCHYRHGAADCMQVHCVITYACDAW